MILSFFTEFSNVIAGITTHQSGNFSNTLPNIHQIHAHLVDKMKMQSIATAQLIHTDISLNIQTDHILSPSDALISQQKQMLIGVTTADCIPVFLYDPISNSVGIVHSGRKGLHQKITTKTIQHMVNDFLIDIKNLQVQIGPHICSSCYEVSSDILREFSIFEETSNGYLNMQDILIQDLLQIGIQNKYIQKSPFCTLCSYDIEKKPLFFSHRRQDPERMLSFIGLV